MTPAVRIAAFALLLFGPSIGRAGSATEPPAAAGGTPFITTYSYQDYDAHPQNWAIAQDERGVMYFGNSGGVLEFDGGAWRRFEVPNNSIVRSLAVGHNGALFVGAVGELGYLRKDEDGHSHYTSLVDQLPEDQRRFADVWRTFVLDDGVFFWTPGKLFRWHRARFQILETDGLLVPAVIDGKLYHNHKNVGLTVFAQDAFEPVEGGEALAETRVDVLLPDGDGGFLVGSRDGRLHRLTLPAPGQLEPFATDVDTHLATHKLYTGVRLGDGAYALTTMDGGVVVVGPAGELRHRFDHSNGLPDNSAWSTFLDREGGLWLGLNRGLARVEIGLPIRVFGPTSGLEGTVEAITRHRKTLYVGAGGGLFRQFGGRFERVPEVVGPCWCLLSVPAAVGDVLLAGCTGGVFEIAGDRARRLQSGRNAFQLYRPASDPARVWVGRSDGLGALRYLDGGWRDQGALPGIRDEIRGLAEDRDGRLWLATHFAGLLRLELASPPSAPGPDLAIRQLRRFGTEHGLPALQHLKIFALADDLLFATEDGLWRFDATIDRFEPSHLLGAFGINRLAAGARGDLWISRTANRGPAWARRRDDGSFEIEDRMFRLLPKGLWYALLPETDGGVWLGGTEGLYRFDSTVDVDFDRDFHTFIRTVLGREGATLHTGTSAFDRLGQNARADAPLPFEANSLIFHFSATSFSDVRRMRYRHRLEGYEENWSDWSRDTKKEYTNLQEGAYTFRVQGRNIFEKLGSEATFEFRILPPWYRTIGFRLAAALAFAGLLGRISRVLVTRARKSQQEISERERAAERERLIKLLREQNAELESFSYSISHDLKSPLLTIKGFVGMLREDLASGKSERVGRDLERIEAAAEKMRRLLEDLLELSRVGHPTHSPEEVPFDDLVHEALELVSGEIDGRGVDVAIAPGLPRVTVDRAQLVAVLQNLLQNAAKYMGEQTAPRVHVGARNNGRGDVFFVRDNGVGIEPKYREKIFGLFERLDASAEGTGIGLALAKRIVEAHGGRIWVESPGPGRGSSFCFTLPRAEPAPLP